LKTLYIIRHSKSSWDNQSMNDFDRPLNDRGKKNAPFMAIKLKEKGINPDLIMTSNAKRALKTAGIFAETLNYSEKKIEEDQTLYHASVQTLLKTVCKIKDVHAIVFLFGHNPGLTDFANYLTNGNIYNIPTTGIVKINFDVDSWKEVSRGNGMLSMFDYPKNYKENH
jgi:phosphohistidine phosphatase